MIQSESIDRFSVQPRCLDNLNDFVGKVARFNISKWKYITSDMLKSPDYKNYDYSSCNISKDMSDSDLGPNKN